MTVHAAPPGVEAAVQIVEDFIKGQEAAARVDAAMAVVREWLQSNADRRRRLNEDLS
jgi:hypothetical protein